MPFCVLVHCVFLFCVFLTGPKSNTVYHSVSLYSVHCCLQYITMQDWFRVFGTGAILFCVLVQCVLLVLCIRDRCNTILCRCTVYIAASHIWFCVFGTGAIPFCVFVQCILLPPIYQNQKCLLVTRQNDNHSPGP